MFTINIKRKAPQKTRKTRPKTKAQNQNKKTDISKLRGYENIYRIRVGNLRIVYEVLWNERTILIHYIGPREKAYE